LVTSTVCGISTDCTQFQITCIDKGKAVCSLCPRDCSVSEFFLNHISCLFRDVEKHKHFRSPLIQWLYYQCLHHIYLLLLPCILYQPPLTHPVLGAFSVGCKKHSTLLSCSAYSSTLRRRRHAPRKPSMGYMALYPMKQNSSSKVKFPHS
jgi:hypothetical protein